MKRMSYLAVVALLVSGLSNDALAANQAKTQIAVTNMCCAGCAKKIARKLYEVRGVTAVHYNVKAKSLTITPQRGMTLSPRALWEAVVKGEDQPIRLAGLSGSFTFKPRF